MSKGKVSPKPTACRYCKHYAGFDQCVAPTAEYFDNWDGKWTKVHGEGGNAPKINTDGRCKWFGRAGSKG